MLGAVSALAGGRDRRHGIRVSGRPARWVAGSTAAVSVALTFAGLTLAYVDRQLAPVSLTRWTVSNLSEQMVNVAVPVTGFVLASRRPGS